MSNPQNNTNSDQTTPNTLPVSEITAALTQSYLRDKRIQHIGSRFLPDRQKGIELLELIRKLTFPGFFDATTITQENLDTHVNSLVTEIATRLQLQIDYCLRHDQNLSKEGTGDDCRRCTELAIEKTEAFLKDLPNIRAVLAFDVQAAFDGDPAAKNTDETIFCYPGIDAIFTYRIANALYRLNIPILPRILSEYVHNETGIDIHPGATIGKSFFIDHGTGVVIGETTVIGDRVKIYQGVTLGAISFPRNDEGELIRGTKRHPTIEDDVTIYANAIILGGNTVIGHGSVIGGAVFLTKSIPPKHYITLKAQDLKYRSSEIHDRLALLPHSTEPYESQAPNIDDND